MNVSVRTHPAGFPVYTVISGDSEFELSSFGAQLISWSKGGVPIMFSNAEHAVFDGVAPYRGGAPICFPHFGKGLLLPGGPTVLPQHGGARTTVWSSEVRETSIALRTEQPSPDGFGPTTLSCELEYFFDEDLRIEARIANVGENETPFQLAVHSYWACADASSVTVRGLGEAYLDNLAGYQESFDSAPDSPHAAPYDRVYTGPSEDLELVTEAYDLSISTQGGSAAVLWNPGPNHPISDLGIPNFVCVENGVIYPAEVLPAGAERQVSISYRSTARR